MQRDIQDVNRGYWGEFHKKATSATMFWMQTVQTKLCDNMEHLSQLRRQSG